MSSPKLCFPGKKQFVSWPMSLRKITRVPLLVRRDSPLFPLHLARGGNQSCGGGGGLESARLGSSAVHGSATRNSLTALLVSRSESPGARCRANRGHSFTDPGQSNITGLIRTKPRMIPLIRRFDVRYLWLQWVTIVTIANFNIWVEKHLLRSALLHHSIFSQTFSNISIHPDPLNSCTALKFVTGQMISTFVTLFVWSNHFDPCFYSIFNWGRENKVIHIVRNFL